MTTTEGINITDNFLDSGDFESLRSLMCNMKEFSTFPWAFASTVDYEGEGNRERFQFVHVFYINSAPVSATDSSGIMGVFMEKLRPKALYRIKANLLTRTDTIEENEFHVDTDLGHNTSRSWTTSIFYVNTNDGYTEFQDGRLAMENTIVKSVANRMVTFPANLMHRGTSCTNEKIRVVINFNYVAPEGPREDDMY